MSELRCRVGDLVRYVGKNQNGRANVYGWVGRVIKFEPSAFDGPAWIVDPPLPGGDLIDCCGVHRPAYWIQDSSLRPIRPSDEPDEILTLAGKPQEVAA